MQIGLTTYTGFIYDNHSHALVGASVNLSGAATHHKTTNATGEYKFTRLHPGSFTITVSASGFVTQTKTVNVTANGTEHIDFTMVAVAGGGNTGTTQAPASN